MKRKRKMGDSQSEAPEGMVLDTRLEIFKGTDLDAEQITTALHTSVVFVSEILT